MIDKATIEALAITLSKLAELSEIARKEHLVNNTIDQTFDHLAERMGGGGREFPW